jgi:hypothetical protein
LIIRLERRSSLSDYNIRIPSVNGYSPFATQLGKEEIPR